MGGSRRWEGHQRVGHRSSAAEAEGGPLQVLQLTWVKLRIRSIARQKEVV